MKAPAWTAEDDVVLAALFPSDLHIDAIASRLSRSRAAIYLRGAKLGLSRPRDMAAIHRARSNRARSTFEERFWAKIMPEPNSGCWLWTGAVDGHGYGQIRENNIARLASRISWRLSRGSDPGDRWVLHRCDVPLCANPDHLFLGSPKENTADMMAKGRHDHSGLDLGRGWQRRT